MKRWFPYLIAFLMGPVIQAADRFPSVSGRDLHGNEVAFPAAFESHRCTLVIVAYFQKQQEIIDPWLPDLAQLSDEFSGFAFYELPTIRRMNFIMRRIIHRGMRSGIPSAAARSRTVTLHLDKGPFNEALGVRDENAVYFFLVDAKGRIHWRATGERTEETLTELRRQVAGLTGN